MSFGTVLVTGGAGFVGSHLVDRLVKCSEKVVVVDNFFLGREENLEDARREADERFSDYLRGKLVVYREDCRYLGTLENIFEREKPDTVFDLAVKPLPYSFIDPHGTFATSVEVAQNLAHLLLENRFSRLLHFSSSEAYGTLMYNPMDEKHPLNPTSPYGAGKAAADLLLLSYAKMFDLADRIWILRPFNMYGPRQNLRSYAAVVPITIKRILCGEQPVVDGDGEQTRDLVYVCDVVQAALDLVNCPQASGKVVNVGSGNEYSINTIIASICEELGFPFKGVKHGPARPADVRRLCCDISLVKQLINFSPCTPFEAGLKNTIAWYNGEEEHKHMYRTHLE